MNKVPVGPATVVGYILSALLAGATAWSAAEHELSGTGKWLAILSVISAVTTNYNRSIQAAPVSEEAPPEI